MPSSSVPPDPYVIAECASVGISSTQAKSLKPPLSSWCHLDLQMIFKEIGNLSKKK